MNPLFQLSTRSYDKEIRIVKHALQDLESQCNVKNGFLIETPFDKFGWTFFNIQLSEELVSVIEKTGMMEGALGYRLVNRLLILLDIFLRVKAVT